MNTNKILFSIVMIVVLVGGSLGIYKVLLAGKPIPPKSPKQENVLNVHVATVVYQDYALPIQYHGRVRSSEIVNLASEVSGRILPSGTLLKEGQNFKKGKLLINIYSDNFKATLKANKSNFLTSLAGILPDVEVDYKPELAKWQAFFKAIDLDKSLPDLPTIISDQEKVFLASRNILSAYYNIKQQEITLSRYKIYAPFDGVYTSVSQEVGAQANPGQSLARIIRTDQLEIVAEVLPEDAHWIKKNDEVSVLVNGETHPAKVIRKASFVDQTTQTVKIYARTKAPLLDGQFVEVQFKNLPYEAVMQLPREAIFNTDQVFIVEGDKLKSRTVQVIKKQDDHYLIQGLAPQTQVVNESLVNVKEGLKVNPLK